MLYPCFCFAKNTDVNSGASTIYSTLKAGELDLSGMELYEGKQITSFFIIPFLELPSLFNANTGYVTDDSISQLHISEKPVVSAIAEGAKNSSMKIFRLVCSVDEGAYTG